MISQRLLGTLSTRFSWWCSAPVLWYIPQGCQTVQRLPAHPPPVFQMHVCSTYIMYNCNVLIRDSLVNTIFCRLHYNTESSSFHSQQFIKPKQDRYLPCGTRNERIKCVKGRRQKFCSFGWYIPQNWRPHPEGSQIEPFFPIVPSKSLSVCTRNFLDSISLITLDTAEHIN